MHLHSAVATHSLSSDLGVITVLENVEIGPTVVSSLVD